MSLIDTCHRFAGWIDRIKPIIWIAFVAALGGALWVFFQSSAAVGQDAELLFVALSLWFGTLLAFAAFFKGPVQRPREGDGWFRKLGLRIRLGVSWLMGVVFVGITVVVLWLIMRAVLFML